MKAVAAITLISSLGFGASAFASDGAIDTSFGTAGIARVGITDADEGPTRCRPVLQPDQKILVCGTRLENGAIERTAVRMNELRQMSGHVRRRFRQELAASIGDAGGVSRWIDP